MSATTVQSFYIAYYGRPADPSGLEYWVGRVEAEGGSFDSLVAAFGTSAEATELFSGLTDAQKINAVYQSTFGRDADAEGLAFYSAGLADGSFSLYDISKRILDGATSGDDAAIVANKISVAQAFTDELAADPELAAEYVGLAATTSAKAIISAVDASAESVTTAVAAVASNFSITTTALTASVDTVTGTDGRDRISGTVASLGGTLQATDVIDGGAGTSDRLSLSMDVAFTGFSTGSVKNVETIALTNNGATGRNFDATGVTGAKTFSLDGTIGGLTLTSLPTGVEKISVTGQTVALTSTYTAGAAEQSASTTALTLDLNNVGTSSSRVTATLDDVNVLTINASGANVVSIGGTDATSVTVTGDGSLDATVAASSLVRSVDGSAATGNLTLNLSGVAPSASSSGITSVKTGAGADSITLAVEDIRANATVDAGSGADTLTLTNAGGTASVAYTLTGVETVAIGSAAGSAALTFAANGWGDVTTMSIKGGSSSNTGSSVTVAGLGARDITLNMLGDVATAATASLDNSGAAVVNFKADTAAEIAGTSVATPDSNVTFGSASSLTANVEANVAPTSSVTLTATKASSVTLNVADGKSAAGSQQTAFYGDISAPAATTVTINSTGILGSTTSDRVNLSAAKATSLTVENGASAGWLTVADPSKLTSLTVTSGAAFDIGLTAAAAKVQNLTLGANKGKITVSTTDDFAAVNSVTVSGSGTGSAIALGTLGATANGYDLSVTASGTLPGATSTYGFSAEAISVAKGKNVSLDFSSVTGAINLSTIGADASNEAGNVTLTAPLAGSSSAAYTSKGLTVGSITASGDVTVTATKAKAASIADSGTITGNNVTVDISGVETADYSLGAISAKSSASISLSPLASADTVAISSQSASTGLAVTVNGGISIDTINVTGTGASVASITMTGDLGAGDDVVTINGYSAKAKSISIASLENYDTAQIIGSSAADTITGGAGKDTITGAGGQDALTGGAGVDVFLFNTGDSRYSAPDTITDLGSTDIIAFADSDTTTLKTSTPTTASIATSSDAGGITGAGGTIAVSSYGVATFTGTSTGYDTLAEKAGILSALLTSAGDIVFFADSSTTYMFISDGTTSSTLDVVIALTGVALPSAAPTAGTSGSDTTSGLTGIAS